MLYGLAGGSNDPDVRVGSRAGHVDLLTADVHLDGSLHDQRGDKAPVPLVRLKPFQEEPLAAFTSSQRGKGRPGPPRLPGSKVPSGFLSSATAVLPPIKRFIHPLRYSIRSVRQAAGGGRCCPLHQLSTGATKRFTRTFGDER